MLKELRLNNLILIESSIVTFDSGFNVLSGESGSGKSAIMNALNLINGERNDPSFLRRGTEKGFVEAVFEIDNYPSVLSLLESAGIDHDQGNELFIRRELSATGKSRAFINNQLAQLSLLRQVSGLLFDVVGQHANQKLLALDYHRQVLDIFGDHQDELASFTKCWEEELQVSQSLSQLIASEAQRVRQIEVYRMEIEEISSANLKEGEEEELFAEYSKLANADEIAQKANEFNRLLTGDKMAILAHLNRQKSNLEQLVRLAPSLAETAAIFENVLIELHEVSHSLRNFESSIEIDPQRALDLNERLELITRLKRKYGTTIHEIQCYLKHAQDNLVKLEHTDIAIEELQKKLKILSEKTNTSAYKLSELRKQTAKNFQESITSHLLALNMPKVEFSIEFTHQKRSRLGDDKIEFFLTPNVGEHRVPLRECASGGELSRIMLAIQALLAGKENTPTLIFDEIDANIGGETAAVVGEKLRGIGHKHQVLCITHFPQVAKLAGHHLRIFKQEIDGRTVTLIELLNEFTRERELTRMFGGIS